MASRPGTLDLALKRTPEAFASRYSVGVDVVHPYVYLVALEAASQVPPEGGHARHAMEGRRTHGRRLPQTLATLSPTWPPVDCSTSGPRGGPGVTFTWAILICVFRYSSPALAGRCYSPQVYCVLAGLYLAWARQGRPGSGPGHAAVRPPPPPGSAAQRPAPVHPSPHPGPPSWLAQTVTLAHGIDHREPSARTSLPAYIAFHTHSISTSYCEAYTRL